MMDNRDSWHSQDAFWELIEPVLFNKQRQSSAQEEVDKIVKLLQIKGQDTILDLCCGRGRHSLEFSRRGFDVTGVDRTTSYIEKARLEAEKLNLNVAFMPGDMRDYCVPNNFDIIINMFGSFGYFENSDDDQKVVANMYASLRAGGQFLIETMGKELLARDFQKREWSEEGDLLILSERKVSQNWARIETRWIVIQGTKRVEHRVSVRSYSAVELSSLLFDCGFPEVAVYGSLDGIEYDQMAQRLVVVGQK
jgi:SAM-dependent methyltransferase